MKTKRLGYACAKCGSTRLIDDLKRNRKGERFKACKNCRKNDERHYDNHKEGQKAYREAHKEERKEQNIIYRETHKEEKKN